jgi:GGDEF domain-containing protein
MKSSPLSAPAAVTLSPLPGMSWLGVAAMLADLAFETDTMGRFTGFGPGRALGQPPAQLMGGELAALITGGSSDENAISAAQFREIVATICAECVAWHGRVRLAKFDGTSGFYRLSLAPRLAGSAVSGMYGLLFDLDAPELTLPDRDAGHPSDPALRHNALLDSQTGLWSGRTFADEVSRRLDRLDVEEQPGTLLYLGFSRAQPVNRVATALRLAEELRDIVRPTDLLGRIDETTIGLWCDNMDHLTGGERAARFCTILPPLLPERTPLTVGVASRWSGSGEDASSVLEHAAIALRLADMAAERAGAESQAGAWRVWQRD